MVVTKGIPSQVEIRTIYRQQTLSPVDHASKTQTHWELYPLDRNTLTRNELKQDPWKPMDGIVAKKSPYLESLRFDIHNKNLGYLPFVSRASTDMFRHNITTTPR